MQNLSIRKCGNGWQVYSTTIAWVSSKLWASYDLAEIEMSKIGDYNRGW